MSEIISTLTSSGVGSTDTGDTIINGGMLIEAGAASGTVISASGVLSLISRTNAAPGTAIATMVLNGGTEIVSAGATDSGSFVSSGGTLVVLSGGTAIDDTVESGGSLVLSGGIASNTIVVSGGQLMISGGAAFATTVASGGSETVASGIASQTIVSGTITVLSNAFTLNTTVLSGGTLVNSGGYSIGSQIFGQELLNNGSSTRDTIEVLGAIDTVSGVITDMVVSPGGFFQPFTGNVFNNLVLGSGIFYGGLGTDNTYNNLTAAPSLDLSFTDVLDISGNQIVAKGENDLGDVISSGVTALVGIAANLISSTVLSGGTVLLSTTGAQGSEELLSSVIEYGASVVVLGSAGDQFATISNFIAAGATLTVSGSGVYEVGDDISGTLIIGSGAYAESPVVDSGGQIYVQSGGTALFQTIPYGPGTVYVAQGGTVYLPIIPNPPNLVAPVLVDNGGYYTAIGQTASGTIITNEFESIGASGFEQYQIAGSGAELNVAYGGSASGLVAASGGFIAAVGGSVLTTTVLSGGTFGSYEGVASGVFVSGTDNAAGGTQMAVTVSSGGLIRVSAFNPGDVVSNATILSGGTAVVSTGGSAEDFTIEAGGVISVGSGGDISGLVVKIGATISLNSGTSAGVSKLAGSAIVEGGVGYVVSGGLISSLAASPLAGSIVGSGVTVGLNASGVAQGLIVGTGGQLLLSSGTSGSQLSISGGTLLLRDGAVVTSGIDFAAPNGKLVVGNAETAVISGFGNGQGETIMFSNLAFAPGGVVSNTGSSLIVSDGGSSVTLNVVGVPNFAQLDLVNSAGLLAVTACYAAGTRIATARGDVAIEHISVGETLLLADGGSAPVIWAGKRTLDLTRHPEPEWVKPVRILAGALAPSRPLRDLIVSPRHALCIDGALFEAISLVNGATIVQEHAARRITYYHVELPAHGVIIAEGQPAETYVDRGNRHMFEGEMSLVLHPQPDSGNTVAETCLPVHRDGAILEGLRLRLIERALGMGFAVCEATGLEVLAGGRRLRPLRAGLYSLPPGLTAVELRSTPFYAGETTSAITDSRRLGAPLRAARLLHGGTQTAIDLTSAAHQGLYTPTDGTVWTNGAATVALPAYQGAALLQLDLGDVPARLARAVTG